MQVHFISKLQINFYSQIFLYFILSFTKKKNQIVQGLFACIEAHCVRLGCIALSRWKTQCRLHWYIAAHAGNGGALWCMAEQQHRYCSNAHMLPCITKIHICNRSLEVEAFSPLLHLICTQKDQEKCNKGQRDLAPEEGLSLKQRCSWEL